MSGYECTGCGRSIEDDGELVYTCPQCGGNLQVLYDYGAIAKKIGGDGLAASDERGIWRYLDLLPVSPDTERPMLSVGGTPLYEAPRLGAALSHERLYIKDETRQASASFKDRASAVALVKGIELGAGVFTGASTGNAGSSMACLCASMGISPAIFVPHTAPRAKVAQLLLFGARVIAVRGSYDQAFDLCLAATEKFGWYNRNTGYNPFTREGKKTCSFEIAEQLGWRVPDVVAVSVGDGNIISGLWKGWTELKRVGLVDRLPRMMAVQSSRSNSIARAIEEGRDEPVPVQATTIADSISVDLPRDGVAAIKAIRESGGFAVEVDDDEIIENIGRVARHSGVFGEPAGVTPLAGIRKAAAGGLLDPDWTVVAVVTGSGLKDVDSALKAAGSPRLVEPNENVLDEVAAFVEGQVLGGDEAG